MTATARALVTIFLTCILLCVGALMTAKANAAAAVANAASGVVTAQWTPPVNTTANLPILPGALKGFNLYCRELGIQGVYDAPVRVDMPATKGTIALSNTNLRACAVTSLMSVVTDDTTVPVTTVEVEGGFSLETVFTPTPVPRPNPPSKPTVTVNNCLILLPGAPTFPCVLKVTQ